MMTSTRREPLPSLVGEGYGSPIVMAGLVPAIHDFLATSVIGAPLASEHGPASQAGKQSVDGRHKAGHDDGGSGKAA